MKLITFVIPCFNSQEYLHKCVESLLPAGAEAEIIVVNDGSTDNTSTIAHVYQTRFPSIVKVIDKPNAGHGSAVNVGLDIAAGMYFKVVDSDDCLDAAALSTLMQTIKKHAEADTSPDLYIANFAKERVSDGKIKILHFKKFFPKQEIFGWQKVKKFGTCDYIFMHNLVYKTSVLRQYGLVLPENTFYVDNLFTYNPLPLAQKVCFLDVPLYRYSVGREGQSVAPENITKRYQQQISVMLQMTKAHCYEQIVKLPKGLKNYMLHYLAMLMSLTVLFTTAGKDNKAKRKADLKSMWAEMKAYDTKMYNFLRHRSYTCLINWMPFSWQGKFSWMCYKMISKILMYE